MGEGKKVKRPRGVARLIPDKCIACGARCQSSCPADSIEMNDKGEPIIIIEKCIGCRKCLKVCPTDALEMYYTPEEQKILAELAARAKEKAAPEAEKVSPEEAALLAKLKEYKGVWVFVEQTEGEPAGVSWELLGVGAELAKTLGVELCSVVVGDKVENLCQKSFAYGATKSYLVDNPIFHYYRTEPYYEAICYLVRKYKPEIMLMGATGLGRDLAATVRPHVMQMPEKDISRKGEIIRETVPVKEEDFVVKVLEVVDERKAGAVDVAAADIIVSGGRGMRAKENFHLLQELADELDGVVGSSRGAVDAGWMPAERQVGQTGKTVRPKIYIACGISGAIQHLVGMQDSDTIIAINIDKNAPIFEVATYGIVGDVLKIVPLITNRIKEMRARGEKYAVEKH